jgi:hypothetical protein
MRDGGSGGMMRSAPITEFTVTIRARTAKHRPNLLRLASILTIFAVIEAIGSLPAMRNFPERATILSSDEKPELSRLPSPLAVSRA